MDERRVLGWLDTDVYCSHDVRELMLARLTEAEHRNLGTLDPRIDESRKLLADLLYERISALYEANNRDALCVWMNILGAAVVKLAERADRTEHPSMLVPGTQDDRGRELCLYLLSGTLGERIMLRDPYPYLCFVDDEYGLGLRQAFRTLFGPRVICRPIATTDGSDDGTMYVVLKVSWAGRILCPCKSDRQFSNCHGADSGNTGSSNL